MSSESDIIIYHPQCFFFHMRKGYCNKVQKKYYNIILKKHKLWLMLSTENLAIAISPPKVKPKTLVSFL